MTRHERRKRARLMDAERKRKAIVRANLGTPVERVHLRGTQVSRVYLGEGGRARGLGVVPMTHKVQRVLSDSPYVRSLGAAGKDTGSTWRV
jgi:hypothetical protein